MARTIAVMALCALAASIAGVAALADGPAAPVAGSEPIGAKNAPRVDLLRTLEGPTDWARCVVFQPGGTLLAVGSKDGNVRIWNLATSDPPTVIKAAPC